MPRVTSSLTEEAMRAPFELAPPFTVGAEEELTLVHPRSFALLAAAPRAVENGADPRLKPEFAGAVVELTTSVCTDADEVLEELRALRSLLRAAIDGWARVLATGAHPFAPVMPLSPGERYTAIADRLGALGPRAALACGLHVHVGVPGADRALAVVNALRSYLPELAALAANAPLLDGRDSGLASVRPHLCQLLPRQGVPPPLRWDELAALTRWGAPSGAVPDTSQLWWEVRPHVGYGTVEVRVFDQPTRVEQSWALVGVVHALVHALARRYDRGEALPVHDTLRIAENRTRALLGGLGGAMLDLDDGRESPTREHVLRLLLSVEDDADLVGAGPAVAAAYGLAEQTGSDRQRQIARLQGARGLARWLADETERDGPPVAPSRPATEGVTWQ